MEGGRVFGEKTYGKPKKERKTEIGKQESDCQNSKNPWA